MTTTIIVYNCSDNEAPEPHSIQCWVEAAIADRKDEAELSIRIVGTDEAAELNTQYRGKQGPTNVLSFPADLPEVVALPLLGDIVLCAPLVLKEAREQGKSAQAHWAHLVIHGTLHLLGYDHIDKADAAQMEALETSILGSLNYPAPYTTDSSPHTNSSHGNENQDL
ncbi:MAG: rRNA maturation RNase YbeY [Porticoccaceae bacterium]|nr:rRNA maturation RNase YbeY [Porticoccaceae bacterium]